MTRVIIHCEVLWSYLEKCYMKNSYHSFYFYIECILRYGFTFYKCFPTLSILVSLVIIPAPEPKLWLFLFRLMSKQRNGTAAYNIQYSTTAQHLPSVGSWPPAQGRWSRRPVEDPDRRGWLLSLRAWAYWRWHRRDRLHLGVADSREGWWKGLGEIRERVMFETNYSLR